MIDRLKEVTLLLIERVQEVSTNLRMPGPDIRGELRFRDDVLEAFHHYTSTQRQLTVDSLEHLRAFKLSLTKKRVKLMQEVADLIATGNYQCTDPRSLTREFISSRDLKEE